MQSSRPAPHRPRVGIPCDWRMLGPHPFHAAGEKYITAVVEGAGAVPLLLPVLDPPLPPGEILGLVDGLLFTGSVSNVAPHHYGGPAPRDGVLQDTRRDATALPLLTAAIAAGVPTLCICRGFQELNVAFGGTLHQHLEEVPGRFDHRENKDDPLPVQYGPAHDVTLHPGGLLAGLARAAGIACDAVAVNSLHGQGIDRLAPPLTVEATAPDGTIEAVRVTNASAFALGVQWHPEWRWAENTLSSALFRAFGRALRGEAVLPRKEHLA